VPVTPQQLAAAGGGLGNIIQRKGVSPSVPVAERTIVPRRNTIPAPAIGSAPTPAITLSPLAAHLRANLPEMKRHPDFADLIPQDVTAIAEESPEAGAVYLFDAERHILGRIEPHRVNGKVAPGKYVYTPLDREVDKVRPFTLDLARPVALPAVALAADAPALAEPIRQAFPPGCGPAGARDLAASCRQQLAGQR
jgi:hypothetical protein